MTGPGSWPPQPASPHGRLAIVRLDGQRVGHLVEVADRRTRFVYDPAWLARPDAVPVSLTLPLRAEPYDSVGLHPFFENLLPEGWLLHLTTSKLKIPATDTFGLLVAACADCPGAVEIVPPDAEPGAAPQAGHDLPPVPR